MIWIIIAIIVVLVIFVIASYNGLVKSRMQTKEAWSQIDVQLKRRNDLLPNLIETVKGYAKYEGSTLEKVAEALDVPMWQLFASPEEVKDDTNTITCPHCGGKIHFDGEPRMSEHKNIRGKEYYK